MWFYHVYIYDSWYGYYIDDQAIMYMCVFSHNKQKLKTKTEN